MNTTPYIHFFVCEWKINAKMKAKTIAAAIPPAVAVSPPVKIPSNPCDFTAPITPLASDAPKPIIGTLMPAPAKSEIYLKTPTASKNTPISTNVTSMRAEVMLVVIINISPIMHTNPPMINTHK